MTESSEKNGRVPEILFIPGLGGDLEMFFPILSVLFQRGLVLTPRFFSHRIPRNGETLEEYTSRVTGENGLSGKEFDLVVGISLGGVIGRVALQNGWVRAGGFVSIASAPSGQSLTWFSRWSARILKRTPLSIIRPSLKLAGLLYPMARFFSPWARVIGRMVRRADPALIRWAPEQIGLWSGGSLLDSQHRPIQILSIHGTRDPLFSFEKNNTLEKIDLPIEKGSHIIFLTSPEEIARGIESFLNRSR